MTFRYREALSVTVAGGLDLPDFFAEGIGVRIFRFYDMVLINVGIQRVLILLKRVVLGFSFSCIFIFEFVGGLHGIVEFFRLYVIVFAEVSNGDGWNDFLAKCFLISPIILKLWRSFLPKKFWMSLAFITCLIVVLITPN